MHKLLSLLIVFLSLCCSYLFWDGLHPTQAVSAKLFQAAWLGNSTIITPVNLKTLVAPAASKKPRRRRASTKAAIKHSASKKAAIRG